MAVSNDKTRIYITITKAMKEELTKKANKENRSLSNYASTLFIQYYEQLKSKE